MASEKPNEEDLEKKLRKAYEEEVSRKNDALLATIGQLKESEKQFMLLVDNAPEPIFIQTDRKFAYVNKALLTLYGAESSRQLLGTPVLARIPAEFKEMVKARIRALNEDKIHIARSEYQHMKLDGTLLDVEVSAVPIVYRKKNGALVFVRDVTDRKRAEAEIRQKNEFIETVLDHLPIGLALNAIDDGTATYVNKKFSEIYGWPAEDLADITAFFKKVYPDESYRTTIMTRILSDIRSGKPENMHWENIRVTGKDGIQRIINAVNIPLTEQNTMVSTVMDVTGQKQAENALRNALEKAEESDRLKTAFLQNMSHEIRTPMNAICGFSEMLKEEDLTPDKKKTFIEIIINSTSQLLSIVNDILSISTIETRQAKVNLKGASVNALLSELHAMFKPKAVGQQLVLSISPGLPDNLSVIRTDETKLRQILTNLIGNALKFTYEGYVEFGYYLKGNELEFFVKDTGIGVDPELKLKIFERFFQADTGVSRRYGGTGLGLSISRSFVELLGGRIWVEPRQVRGSVFLFTVPYLPGEIAGTHLQGLPIASSATTILIAEDEEYNYLYLAELLSKTNATLIHAWNGREAVDICTRSANITLVIMDLKMPVMDGYEATRMIRQFRPGLNIIAHTAYALPTEIEEMGGAGFNGYLEKPVLPQQLFELMAKYLK